ncbi:MAG: Hsp70 family protein [Opitutales bacterium]
MSKSHSLGIDLGTSNSALALAPVAKEMIDVLDVTQLISRDSIGEKKTLPSAVYLPSSSELPNESALLPWSVAATPPTIIGHFAREHGALLPDRLIVSSKSWLCQTHLDRKAPILPWNSENDEEKLSPFEASRRILEHLRENFRHHKEAEGVALKDCEIVLTVPASFDEVARSLTHDAAVEAGFGKKITLLEEPQAAFYAWLAETGDAWRQQIQPGEIVLVCDVGGGTADFSLIAVSEEEGNLELERISVGDHILLGGDNMDLALAYTIRATLEGEGKTIDDWQFLALIHASRLGKEALFRDSSLDSFPISLPTRGASLFGKTLSTQLSREQLQAVVLDGFLPMTSAEALPMQRPSVGLQEYGLAYASDPILSKHLARFLTRSLQNVKSNENLARFISAEDLESSPLLRPTAVLFNGGVFNAPGLRKRVMDLLHSWTAHHPVKELSGAQLDLAVAKGGAFYGKIALTGKGLRIRAGAARSYYIGLESSMPAVPGFKPPVKAVCVVPQGMEEGTEQMLEGKEFGLVTGEPVTFRFFSSPVRAGDEIGMVVRDAEKELEETSELQVTLDAFEGQKEGEAVPVTLKSVLTELGALELWMEHVDSEKHWKLEFNIRGGS